MMSPLTVTAMATANPLGPGLSATWSALRAAGQGLRPKDFEDAQIKTWIGRVEGLETDPIAAPVRDDRSSSSQASRR